MNITRIVIFSAFTLIILLLFGGHFYLLSKIKAIDSDITIVNCSIVEHANDRQMKLNCDLMRK